MRMRKISVVVPFYKGNKYLDTLKTALDEACSYYQERVEVILVNDSPDEQVDKNRIESERYDLIIISHIRNQGIHQARVTGLCKSNGEYVLFLDQDDSINKNFFMEMGAALDKDKSIAFVYANGVFEDENGNSKLILNSYGKAYGVKNYKTLLKSGNLLASPVQCLIRKSCIPAQWIENIMKTNCADDYFLWLLMVKEHNVKYVNRVLYEHITTGENTSGNKMAGYKSDLELYQILDKLNVFSDGEIKKFGRRCSANYNKAAKKEYSHFDWYYSHVVERFERLKMKIIGYAISLTGETLCSLEDKG